MGPGVNLKAWQSSAWKPGAWRAGAWLANIVPQTGSLANGTGNRRLDRRDEQRRRDDDELFLMVLL